MSNILQHTPLIVILFDYNHINGGRGALGKSNAVRVSSSSCAALILLVDNLEFMLLMGIL